MIFIKKTIICLIIVFLELFGQHNATGEEPYSRSNIEYTTNCTFTIKGARNIGTGFFISPSGFAITCKHVVEEGPTHTAILDNQNEFPIGVISTSDSYDLALIIVITSQETPYLNLSLRDPLAMTQGEKIYAIGSSVGLHSQIIDGVFTGLRKKMTEDNVIQFSAPINPGNSGGPLLDKNGEVIGVISWKLVSNKGILVNGVGFAVPSGYLIKEYGSYVEHH